MMPLPPRSCGRRSAERRSRGRRLGRDPPSTARGLEARRAGRRPRGEAFAAWRRFFEALAAQRPLVLVFEDLQWADDGLLDFVDALVDWVSDVPMLVVCTARPELLARRPNWGGGKLNASTVALEPLSDGDTARLMSTLLERAVLASRGPANPARTRGRQPPVRGAVRAALSRARLCRGAAASGDAPGDHQRPPRRSAGG